MKRIIACIISILGITALAHAQMDTLYVSADYTTHIIFASDLTYADLSTVRLANAKIIEQNRNMLAVKARMPFEETTSISALESSGAMHTFIVKYQPSPEKLVIDLREPEKATPRYQSPVGDMITSANGRQSNNASYQPEGMSASTWKAGKAPLLRDVAKYDQKLFHISDKKYDILVLCEDISSHSDITYMTLSIRNRSGISYNIGDPSFVIESKKEGKRTVKYENSIFPRNRYGTLSSGPGEYKRMVFSFDKMTLSEKQVLKIYFYEHEGQRNLVLTLNSKDINKARRITL